MSMAVLSSAADQGRSSSLSIKWYRSTAGLHPAFGVEHFAGVMRGRLVEDGVLDGDQQLIVTSPKAASQREIACLHNDPLPDHGPELLLCNPVLLFVIADNQRGLFDFHTIPRQKVVD